MSTLTNVAKVHLRRESNIAILELDNAQGSFLTAPLQAEINRVTLELEDDPSIRVIILTGKAPNTFMTHYSPLELSTISSAVDADKLMGEAMALAEQMAGQPPLSIMGVKRAVHIGVQQPLAEGIATEANYMLNSLISRDSVALGGRYLTVLEEQSGGEIPLEAGPIATSIFDEFRSGKAIETSGK
jgi:enoyl-CoA hydratase/carnithine racemase